MRDPDLVVRAQRAATALELAWQRWRSMHGLEADPLPPVSSYVGYSLEEPLGQPRVLFGISAQEAEQLAGLLDRHDCVGPVHAGIAGLPGGKVHAPAPGEAGRPGGDQPPLPALGLSSAARRRADGQRSRAQAPSPLDRASSFDPAAEARSQADSAGQDAPVFREAQAARKAQQAAEAQARQEREAAEALATQQREAAEALARQEQEAAEARQEQEAAEAQAAQEREAAEARVRQEQEAAEVRAAQERESAEARARQEREAAEAQAAQAAKDATEAETAMDAQESWAARWVANVPLAAGAQEVPAAADAQVVRAGGAAVLPAEPPSPASPQPSPSFAHTMALSIPAFAAQSVPAQSVPAQSVPARAVPAQAGPGPAAWQGQDPAPHDDARRDGAGTQAWPRPALAVHPGQQGGPDDPADDADGLADEHYQHPYPSRGSRISRGHSLPRLARPGYSGDGQDRDLPASSAALPYVAARNPEAGERKTLAAMAAEAARWASVEQASASAAKDTAV